MSDCGECHDPRVFGHVACQIEGNREAWAEAERARRAAIEGRVRAALPHRYPPENTCYLDRTVQENGVIKTVMRADKHVISPAKGIN